MARIKQRSDGRYVATTVINGKRKYFYGATEREALMSKEEFLKQSINCEYYDGDLTITAWASKWLEIKAKNIAPTTYASYKRMIKTYIIPKIGFIKLAKLNINHIRTLINDCADQGLSTRIQGYIYTLINSMLKQAVLDEIINKNVASKMKKPKLIKKKKMITLIQKEIKAFIKQIESEELKILFKLAFATGLRRSEILGLRWSDINTRNNTISVAQTVVKVDGRIIISPTTKTASSRRTITIDDITMNELKKQRVLVQSRRVKEFRWINNDLVFPNRIGKPLNPDSLTFYCRKYAAAIGKKGFTFHCIRHTHATSLLEQGVNFKVVQVRLGHSSFKETMDTYSHVTPIMEFDIAPKLKKLR